MDPIMTPMKSTLPSGLQVITLRTGCEGLMAGHVVVDVGTIHAVTINPRWEGLNHFGEHMRLFGASRNYAPREIERVRAPELFFEHNAMTTLIEGNYFFDEAKDKSGAWAGQVLPKRNFWKAFELAIDGTFFPEFDSETMEAERPRILKEIRDNQTQAILDERQFRESLFGVNYLAHHNLGSQDQVRSYTRADCLAFNEFYNLSNTTVIVTGDVGHNEVVEKVATILKDVPASGPPLPKLAQPRVQAGEFRHETLGANEGAVQPVLYFPAVNKNKNTCDKAFATTLAFEGLSRILNETVRPKYSLYSCGAGHDNVLSNLSLAYVALDAGEDTAADALAYTIDLLQDPKTHARLASMHQELVGKRANDIEVQQPKIEFLTSMLRDANRIEAPMLSTAETVERYERTTPDQLVGIIRELGSAPFFLGVRGHAGALDAVPPHDVVNAWRSSPQARANAKAAVSAGAGSGVPPLSLT